MAGLITCEHENPLPGVISININGSVSWCRFSSVNRYHDSNVFEFDVHLKINMEFSWL